MNDKKIVNDFSYDEEVRIGVEIEGFIPMEKGDRYCPSSPAEVEFSAYFINGADEVICKVPDELIGYLGLEQRVTEDVLLSREQLRAEYRAEEMKERMHPIFQDICNRMIKRRV